MEKYSHELPAGTITANDDVKSDEIQKSGTVKTNRTILLLAVLFLFGVLLGAVYITKADSAILDTLDYFFFSSIKTRMSHGFFQIFAASAASSFLFLLCIFFGGLTMWGAFFVPVFSVFRGFGFGLTAGYVYGFGAMGVLYQVMMVLPGAMLSGFAIFLASREAIQFSGKINLVHRARTKPHRYVKQPSVRNYAMRIGAVSSFALFGALADVFTALVFSGIFQNHIF